MSAPKNKSPAEREARLKEAMDPNNERFKRIVHMIKMMEYLALKGKLAKIEPEEA